MRNAISSNNRAVIVGGLRTPFLKLGTGYRGVSTLDLSAILVNELICRIGVEPSEITNCVFGHVLPSLTYVNLAREIVLRTSLDPAATVAHSVSQACISSLQAITESVSSIERGEHETAIAGGADSVDDACCGVRGALQKSLVDLAKSNSVVERVRKLSTLDSADVVLPSFTVEPTTGRTMGEHCEMMAKDWGISRQWQDEIALRSHAKAKRAWSSGFYADLVMPVVVPPYESAYCEDNTVRNESNPEDYAKLLPVFDTEHGTITSGNSSPLSGGAAAVVVMSERRARELGLAPLGFFRSWAYASVDPSWQMLIGPAFAIPKALSRANLQMCDIDLVEMHEAFAAQVACTLGVLESGEFCETHFGLGAPFGPIDPACFNVNGGSLALGHPFAATGARMVMQGLAELRRRHQQFALLAICAGGGLGFAAVLEAAQ